MKNEARFFALLQKETKYLGVSCRKGHDGWRYTVNSDCIECVKNRRTAAESRKYMSDYRKKESNKKYQQAYQERYIKTEKYKNQKQKYSLNNRPALTAKVRKYQISKEKRTPPWLTDDDFWLMEQAYELAALRTKLLGFQWHVDHIIPLHGRLVSGLHVPHNLQVLPAATNRSKSNKFVTN